MQTQKDQVEAYHFMMQRMTTALVVGDPTNTELPTRRGRSGLIAGLVVAVLIAVGFGVYGLIVPGGNTAWKQKGAILVEKESGTRYVYRDGRLMPTLNQASAMLAQGPGSSMTMISRSSLAGLARGPMTGIRGAPDTVPTPNELLPGRWLVCPTATSAGGTGLGVSFDIARSQPSTVSAQHYVPVRSVDGRRYLIWRGTKHELPGTDSIVALGLTATVFPIVPDRWLRIVPDGVALAPARIENAGAPGPAVAGRPALVADLFRHDPGNGVQQRYVLLDKGLAPLSATEYALLTATPGRATVEIDTQAVLAAPFSPDQSMVTRVPDIVGLRALPGDAGTVCLEQVAAGAEVRMSVVAARTTGLRPVDEVGAVLPPTRGVLVAEVPVPAGQEKPNTYLITDQGRRFALVGDDSIQALGLGGVQPVAMHTDVLTAIPAGPALRRSAAVAEQGG